MLALARALAAALVALLALAGCSTGSDQAVYGGSFTFVSPGGKTEISYPPSKRGTIGTLEGPDLMTDKTISAQQFKGKVVVVFFGYTQCPDVCPTTMTELAQAKRLLGPLGPQVQGVFITVDPERDTADLLTRYVHAFDPSFIALRADAQRTRATAESFHVFYEKVPGDRPGSYTIDHTAGSFVFDRQGRVRLFMRFGMGPKAWADDLSTLIKESPASH